MMMMLISVTFMMSRHPLSMGLMVMLQALMISVYTGMMNSFMYSYMLMMIILSGMLVLFMYMSSVASNEKFKTKTMLILILPLFAFLEMKQNSHMVKTPTEMSTLNNETTLTMTNLILEQNSYMIIMIAMYLFMTMVVVSSIVNIHEGPMRSKS